MTTTARTVTVLVVCLLTIGAVAPFAGLGAASTTADAGTVADESTATEPTETELRSKLTERVENAEGTTEVIVRLEEAEVGATASTQAGIEALQTHARETQEPVLAFAAEHEGVEVVRQFWITNAVLLRVDTDRTDLLDLAAVDRVREVHSNFETTVEPVEPAERSPDASASAADYNTTYGLDQIDATEVWEEYDTKGEGVKVAVLDTGVDVDHPDIDLYTENGSDPTYPGGWAEFNASGARVGSEPYDSDSHGTHVSGTVSGGNASGEYIGVAPNVDLMHGLVLKNGRGTFAQIVAGIEWAVSEDADVVSMSLGGAGYSEAYVEPIRNAKQAGVVVVASAGNSGEGSTGSPGNVYDTFAIGASNVDRGIAQFSSGEVVVTEEAWGDAAPSDWPAYYTVPDVSAPGVAVKSSVPDGGYAEFSGTSMAAPHVSGAIALMLSAADGDASVDEVESALVSSATKPEDRPATNDTRYGEGIIDVSTATVILAENTGAEGTVTGPDGEPLSGVAVEADNGLDATTGDDGTYRIAGEPGSELTLTFSKFGYATAEKTVTLPEDGTTTVDVTLDSTFDLALQSGQPEGIEAGETANVTVRVANLQTYEASLEGDYSTENATLLINGNEVPWDTTLEVGGYSGEITVGVRTAENATGQFSVDHTFGGDDSTVTVTTGPTLVVEDQREIAVVQRPGAPYGSDVAAALDDELNGKYAITVLDSDEAVERVDEFDAFVVQSLPFGDDEVKQFVDATSGPEIGVVYLDQYGGANAIDRKSAVTGNPNQTAKGYDPSAPGNSTALEVTSDHPIFDGVAEKGDSVRIHEGDFNIHAWFTDYDGTTLADVSSEGTVKGPGIAVNEERQTVLAASLGRWRFVTNEDYTEAADEILANSVEYVSGAPEADGTVTLTDVSGQPGDYVTTTLETDATNVAGYQVRINYDPDVVEFAGIEPGTFEDPVYDWNPDEGTLVLSQARATGADEPVLARIRFELVGERGTASEIAVMDDGTKLNDPRGEDLRIDTDGAEVSIASCREGDVNGDGEVTAADATLVQRYIVGKPVGEFNEACADMNGDGEITAADVTEILRKIVYADRSTAVPA